ncbi:MAG: hypothetical protein L6R41_003551 [Letrouitia leprolyta]|nr:MAG: hypothetical protein L6R41_003551 [Letrouitia leprolyta]
MDPIYFRKPSQAYNSQIYCIILDRIFYFVSNIRDIKGSDTPDEQCIIDILYAIASNLHELCTYHPSDSITLEVADLKHLSKLSRQLLEIDEHGITSAVWELINRKVKSLSDSDMAGAQDSGICFGKTTDQRTKRRHDQHMRPAWPLSQEGVAGGINFDVVVERAPRR